MEQKHLNTLEYPKIITQLAECTHFALSRERAERLMPLEDADGVRAALLDTDVALTMSLRVGEPSFRGVTDVTDSVKRAELGSMLNAGELLNIARLLQSARLLKSYPEKFEDEPSRVLTLFSNLSAAKDLEDAILTKIISEEEIADTASSELLNLRRKIKSTNSKIKEHLNKIIHSSQTQKYLQDPIVTMRQERYVIPVKAEYRSEVKGIVHDSSQTGATLFIEPMPIVEANNELRTLALKEKAEIEKILMELSISVAAWIDEIRKDLSILAELDFIFAKARLALRMDAILPQINENRYICLKKARHPLLQKDKTVPIDLELGGDFHTLVVTGPNTGGKTVTLKTIGLLSAMAQAGLLIPAASGSEVGVFTNIFADIGDEQSIEQSLSTFSSHMVNIVHILEELDAYSLVLFDELGAGTDPVEGAALAISVLEEAASRGARIAATTHYSELKMYAIKTPGVENASCEFNVETLRPTYRILIGVPGKSNAFAIAQKLGLTERVIGRSKALLSQETIQFEDVLQNIEASKRETERQRQEAERYRLEVEKLKEDLQKERESQKRKGQEIVERANEQAAALLEEAKEKADGYLKELNSIMFQKKDKESIKQLEQQRAKLKEDVSKRKQRVKTDRAAHFVAREDLLPGMTVELLDIGQRATVLTLPDSSGNLQVQAGIIKIKTKLSNIKCIVPNQDTAANNVQKNVRRGEVKIVGAKTELDLRGMNVEEGLMETEKFLDNAMLANLEQVTIIHGKGTGVLRQGIHQFLKNNRAIKSYRLGKYGEGESGVTIVELK